MTTLGSAYESGERLAAKILAELTEVRDSLRSALRRLPGPLFGPDGPLPLVRDEKQMEASGLNKRLGEIRGVVAEIEVDVEALSAAWRDLS